MQCERAGVAVRSGGLVSSVCVCVCVLSTKLQRQDYLCHRATVIMSPPMTPECDMREMLTGRRDE